MAYTGNGTTGYIKSSATFTSLGVWTFSFQYRNTAAPGVAVYNQPFSMSDAGASYDAAFSWDHVLGGGSLFMKQSGGAYAQAQVPVGILDANQWYVITCQFTGMNLKVYVDGIQRISIVCSVPPAGVAVDAIALAGAAGTNYFDNGTIAECAVWNIALSDDDIGVLGRKFSPDKVRADALVQYWPLIRDIVPVVGTITSGGGLTVANHPPVWESFGGQVKRFTDDATWNLRSTGGLTISGTSTVTPDFVIACTGGVEIVGDSVVEVGVGFSSNLQVSGGLNRTHIASTANMSGTFALLDTFGNFSTSFFVDSTFRADSGDLANGRISDRLD